jgi:ribosome-associated heat shock protein Hsp15
VPTDIEGIRLDKWLWAARFYKTRKLATDAINGGKVHVNGQRAKPGKEIKIGIEITLSKSGYNWHFTIIALAGQRRSAKDAVLLYQETPESQAARQEKIQVEREHKELFNFTGIDHKPNKKERRLIHKFKEG